MVSKRYETERSKLPERRFIVLLQDGLQIEILTTDRARAIGKAISGYTKRGIPFAEARKKVLSVTIHPDDQITRGRKPGSKLIKSGKYEPGKVQAPDFNPVNFYDGSRIKW